MNKECAACHDEFDFVDMIDEVCVSCHLEGRRDFFTAGIDPKIVSDEERARNRREDLNDYQKAKKRSKSRRASQTLRPSIKPEYRAIIEEHVIPEERQAEMAAEEQISRQASRRYLLPFIERFDKSYTAGWFHKDLTKRLEQFSQDVADKKSPRLMVFVPPRAGKSITSTKNLPAWHLGHHPDHEIIITSYASQLALKFSRGIREILASDEYNSVFPRTKMKDDAKGAENWLTTQNGGLLAAGVGGPLTGNGAHLAIIDDPVKNAAEADSQTVRDSVWEWYLTTFYTRLAPGGGILLIMTRWHHDDLAGRLLEEQKNGGEEWDVVEYPAVALVDEAYRREGEALHPERYDLDAFKRIRKAVGERTWWALYQQRPTPETGDYFKRKHLRWYDELPPLKNLKVYVAWDLAIGQREHNDYTVGLVAGIDHLDRLYLIDLIRGKFDSEEIINQIFKVQEDYKPQIQGIEKGHIEMAIGPFLRKRMRDEHVSINLEPLKPGRQDKPSRARPIQGRIKQGMVFLPKRADWVEPFVAELMQFPNGTFDDQVDALAWLGQMFDIMSTYRNPRANRTPKGWRARLEREGKLKRRQLNSNPMAA